jgi:hypothetical protein
MIASLVSTLRARVLVRTQGSGNFGEQTKDAAFYTLDALPPVLQTLGVCACVRVCGCVCACAFVLGGLVGVGREVRNMICLARARACAHANTRKQMPLSCLVCCMC